MRIWKEELGGITYQWGTCPDGISRCLGNENDSREIIEQRARVAAQKAQRIKRVENKIHAKHPELQLYSGFLPDYDTNWPKEKAGYYIYVLKSRKKNGKYQILYAEKI